METAPRHGERRPRAYRGIPLRTFVPNAITALALCFGLSAVRFAISDQWELAVAAIVVAAMLDGVDGRVARMLRANSRFGAELDSLSDVIAFGVAPAVILYLWSLQFAPKFGWTVALAHALCAALRLARFNSNIDVENQPRKAAGFNTGVPAPAGAGMVLLPLVLWLAMGAEGIADNLRGWWLVMPWTAITAGLLISSLATYSWTSIRIPQSWRLPALALVGIVGALLVGEPWWTIAALTLLYVVCIPFAALAYGRVRRGKQPVGVARPTST